LSVGTHVISAAYSGSINDNSSTSATLTQIVTLAPIAATLTANPNPANQGQPVSIAVTVLSPGLPGPSGNMSFNDLFQGITTTLATTSLVDGQAAFSISTLAVGTHVLTAVYAGSGNYAAGTAPYERRSKNRPRSAARAAFCGGVKGVHRRRLVSQVLP
jgi:hypothetical protein